MQATLRRRASPTRFALRSQTLQPYRILIRLLLHEQGCGLTRRSQDPDQSSDDAWLWDWGSRALSVAGTRGTASAPASSSTGCSPFVFRLSSAWLPKAHLGYGRL